MMLLALLLAAAPTPPVSERALAPIAVMPFKDLSNDPDLKWLSLGIAETMTVDLRKGSHLQVVERDQLNHALAELALQGLKPTEESSATRLGKMVGARTVVLGSYQVAEKQLRIVARFVDVETGVITEAAKVTGPVEGVFELQDAIVVKLAGTPFADAVQRRKAKPGKTLAAYKLYAQSFTVLSDIDRANLLQSALKEDPDFAYAAEDLLELQDRMQRLSAANQVAITRNAEALRAQMHERAGDPQKRIVAVMQLIGQDLAGRRLHTCLRDTEWVLGSDLPEDDTYHVRQFALYQRMNCYAQLREHGLAMQVAENFMSTYPSSSFFQGAQAQLNMWMSERARQLEDDRTWEAKLKLVELGNENERKGLRDRPPRLNQLFSWQEDRCAVMENQLQPAAAVRCFQDMLDHRIPGDELQQRYDGVRMRLIRTAEDAGEFAVARRTAEQFMKDDPEKALRYSVNLVLMSLPED